MVRIINQNNQSYYQCEECGFKYAQKEWAEKCEAWCKEHKSCNLEITKYAIKETSGREKWIQKKEKRDEERGKTQRKIKIKKIIKTILIILIVGGGIFGLIWYAKTRPSLPESEIISKQGFHWHPEIKISILGQKVEIPANLGLGITERPIHTHDNMGVIHLEFSGLVRKDDVRLGKFFGIWGKTFNKDCILDKCSGAEGQLKMLVNGKENSEFENYIMQDGDKIEIIFE